MPDLGYIDYDKVSFHSQIGIMSNNFYDYIKDTYDNVDINEQDIFKALLHTAHGIISRTDYGQIQASGYLRCLINGAHNGNHKIIDNISKHRDKAPHLLIFESTYKNKLPVFIPLNKYKVPQTILTIEMYTGEEKDKTFLDAVIESKMFNRKRWMRELKKRL